MKKERFKLISAVHMFLIKNKKILLLRRSNTGYEDGNYSVPAGHLDGNEMVKEAAIRECLEEIGVNVKEEDLDVSLTMHRKSRDDERIDFFLSVNDWTGNIINNEPNKCDELKWYDVKELPNNIIPYIKAAIEEVNSGTKFTSYGWNDN